MFWGLTPCLDLLEELEANGTLPDAINILLIGGTDARHILKTISRRYLHAKGTRINFYVMELVPEILAKEVLLLNTALQPVASFGPVQKARIFMELFGNTLMRPISAKYLLSQAKNCMDMITDYEYMKRQMPFVTVDIKYRERDYMERVYKFWSAADEFDILEYWDKRLRKTLGVRYDTRNGVFDWDLHMRLHHIGGHQVCSPEYQSFRRNGVAFTWLESEVTKPNRTMVTGVIANGAKFVHYGYLGDIQTGPFVAYGLSCDNKELLKKNNNTNRHRATDVTEYNIREMFHELEFCSEYLHQHTSDLNLGACVPQIANCNVVDTGNAEPVIIKSDSKCLDLPNVTINVLSFSNFGVMQHKAKYRDFFQVIYVSGTSVRSLEKEVIQHIAAPKALMILENQRFVLNFREKELKEHETLVEEKLLGLDAAVCPFDNTKDDYFKFVLK